MAAGAALVLVLIRLLSIGTQTLAAAVKTHLDAVVFAVHESIRDLREAISQLREEIKANRTYTAEVLSAQLDKIGNLDRRLSKIEGEHDAYRGAERRDHAVD